MSDLIRIPTTFEEFVQECCDQCTANDWYCPDLCVWLTKAKKYPIERLQEVYKRYDGEGFRIARAIDNWK